MAIKGKRDIFKALGFGNKKAKEIYLRHSDWVIKKERENIYG